MVEVEIDQKPFSMRLRELERRFNEIDEQCK
jgi:hypothetical protein